MSRTVRRNMVSVVVAVLGSALLAGMAAARPAAPPSPGQPVGAAAAPRVSLEEAEAQERDIYKLNTGAWAFADSARVLEQLAGGSDDPLLRFRNQLNAAINLAGDSRYREAKDLLDEAQRVFDLNAGRLSPQDAQLFQAMLPMAAASIALNEGANYDQAVREAQRSAAIALSSTPPPPPSIAPQPGPTSDPLYLDAELVARANADWRKSRLLQDPNLSRYYMRPLEAKQRLAIIAANALKLQAEALIRLKRRSEALAVNAQATSVLGVLPPELVAWLRAQIAFQAASIAYANGDDSAAKRILEGDGRAACGAAATEGQAGSPENGGAIHRAELAPTADRDQGRLWRLLAQVRRRAGDTPGAKAAEDCAYRILARQTKGPHLSREDVADYLSLLADGATAGSEPDKQRFFEVASGVPEEGAARYWSDAAQVFANDDNRLSRAFKRLQADRQAVEVAELIARRANSAEFARAPTSAGEPDRRLLARARLSAAQDGLSRSERQFAALRDPKSLALQSQSRTLAQVQAQLSPDEAYLQYVFVKGRAYLMLIKKAGSRLLILKPRPEELAARIDKVRPKLGVRTGKALAFNWPEAHALYADLIGPAEGELADVRTLVVEPSGPLFGFPFAALVTRPFNAEDEARWYKVDRDDYTRLGWLGRDKAVELSGGAAPFIALRQRTPRPGPGSVLAFADPQPAADPNTAARELASRRFAQLRSGEAALEGVSLTSDVDCRREAQTIVGFQPLPESRAEAAAAGRAYQGQAKIVEGAAFTDKAVRSDPDLAKYSVILFSTHGVLPDAQWRCWRKPFLLTSFSTGGDSVLDASEIGRLNLDADLVVLSACDTAGKGIGGADSLGGLANSLILAGSRGFVVSHWSVQATATQALISQLFEAGARGRSTVSALADAERSLMNRRETSHPYYWAAFTLFGQGARGATKGPSAATPVAAGS